MSGAVRAKICGLTRAEDVDAAVEAGADAVGFVFAPSPRCVQADRASALARRVPAGVLRVGLLMNPEREAVARLVDRVPLDLLQFHGEADNAFCASFGLPFIRAVSVAPPDAPSPDDAYPDAAGILYDNLTPSGSGGTGATCDWSLVRRGRLPLWLAGGLHAGNVAEAIDVVRPDWVDVSSGVEASPGLKSVSRMRAFVDAVRSQATPNS